MLIDLCRRMCWFAAYLAVTNVMEKQDDSHAARIARFALGAVMVNLQQSMNRSNQRAHVSLSVVLLEHALPGGLTAQAFALFGRLLSLSPLIWTIHQRVACPYE